MKTLLNLLLLALCCLSATACARPLVNLAVVDRDTGEQLAEYGQSGRQYVAGQPGHRYALRLANRTSQRVMVVLSVDGVNVVSGQTAGTGQPGYVLGPWQSTEIAGWRKNYDDIAQFVFTELDDSYAARTGRPDNVGVIGMAVFRERIRQPVYSPPVYSPYGSRDDERYERQSGGYARNKDAPAPSAAAKASRTQGAADAAESGAYNQSGYAGAPYEPTEQRLGTGHGQREYAPTEQTQFERLSDSPQQVVTLYYDAPDRLAARGIIPRRWLPSRQIGPDPFPVGFVPDPPREW